MSGADNTATFAIDLNAQGAQKGAEAAAGSLENLRDQIDEDVSALANMQKALKQLQGGTSVNITAFANLRKQIEAKKATIAQTNERFLQLGGTFKRTKKPVDDNADAMKTLFERMQKGGGPVGGLAERLQSLRALLGSGGLMVIGAVALSAALVGIAAAALVATAALLRYGIAAADAYRNERLQLEGLTKVRNWYGLAADKAGDLQAAIDNVSGSSALGREQINGIATSLYKTNLRGEALKQALEGVATATSAAGESQGSFYAAMYAGAARSGVAIKKLSDDIKARFGAVARAQMLSLDVQSKKLHESFQALFRGLNIESFLEGVKSITDLFSQNTASGRALKQILEIVLQPLIDGLAVVGPIAKRFWQGMILAAQELTIEYYNVRLAFKGAFGDSDLFKNIDVLTLALQAGRVALYTFAIGTLLLGAGIAALVAPLAFVIYKTIQFADSCMKAYTLIKAVDWGSLGTALIDGFVGGITRGVGKVIAAVTNMAGAAKDALRKALDSHSPSRVGFAIGKTLPQGGALGIEKDTPLVAKAARKMGRAATDNAELEQPATLPRSSSLSGGGEAPAASGGGRGAAAQAPSVTWTGDLHVHTQATDAKGIARDLRPELIDLLQGIATTIGAPSNG